MSRIYIAGPMSGYENHNFPAFAAKAAHLRLKGFEVISPAEINPDTKMAWADCMRADIKELVSCQAIALLPGWEKSNGATLERHIAERLEMKIYEPGEV
jgi:nucleoside 2-deoxyribosyltransferase